jgi:hypothetical protein
MPTKRKLVSEAARAMNAARKCTTNAGRKRNPDAERCECGLDTLARCQARGKSIEHREDCPWYKQSAIIV